MENFENLERAGAILTLIGVIWIAVLAFQAGTSCGASFA